MPNKQTVEELAIAISMESDSFKKEMATINNIIKSSEKEFKSISKTVENFEKTFTGLDTKIEKTSKQIDLYNKKLDKQQEQYRKNEKALEDNTKKLEESKTKLKEIEDTQGKNSKAWEEQSKIVEKNSDLVYKNSQKLIRLSADIKSTEGSIEKLSKELKESESAFEGLENKTKSLEEKLADISRESDLTQSEFEKLGTELKSIGDYFNKVGNEMNKLSSQIISGNQKIDAYEQEINKLSATLEKNKQDHGALANEIEKTQQELNQSKNTYDETSQEVIKLKQKLLGLKDEYNSLENEINQGSKELDEYKTKLNTTQAEVNNLSKELKQMPFDKIGKDLKSSGEAIKGIGQDLTIGLSVPLAAAGAAATDASLDFESAFTGVVKTVDMTTSEMEEMEQGIRNIAKEMPTAAEEISGVAESAGQLGIEKDNILEFTETMVELGDTTNLSSEEAASSMAKLANITNMSQDDFDNLGSTVVALGNNMATTEADIVSMGLRLAGAGEQVGMSEAQIMSFASALSSVGIEAEAGGSAFSKVMIEMQLATEKGGESLDNFAKVAGMSSQEFKVAFEEDAAGAILKFIDGLSTAEDRGLSTIGILDEMGISEVRLRDTLLRAAGASDTFSQALDIGSSAWEENNALTKEAETRYSTNASQLEIMKNRINDAAITIGENLLPAILDCAEWIANLAEKFSQLDKSTQETIVVTVALAAAVGPLLMGLGQLVVIAGNASILFGKLSTMMGSSNVAASGLSGVLGGLSGVILPAVVGALVLIIAKLGDNEKAILSLQEKWGGFGVFIGAVMEFISGAVQITLGYIIELIKGGFDIVGAIIDGPGGSTVKDATKRMNESLNLTMEEGMNKLTLTTTRGMSQMRNASDQQLQGTVTSMETIMSAIPNIVDGKYRTAANNLGAQLAQMDYTQITILQGMNDTTKMMFEGIRTGMSVEEASKKVESNLKQMATAGKIDADTMNRDVSSAIEQMKTQMDAKTKEAAQVVDTNTKNAGNKAKVNSTEAAKGVGNAYDSMAKDAKKGSSQVASNTDTDFNNANKAVQQSATDMYNGSKKSYSKMADVAKSESTRMYLGVKNSAEKMSQSAKAAASDMYRGVTTSTRRMADAAISDWNRIRNAYSRPIYGTITKTTINKTVNKKSSTQKSKDDSNAKIHDNLIDNKNIRVDMPTVNTTLPRIPEIDISGYQTRGSYYNVQSYNSSFSKLSNIKDNSILEEKLDTLIMLISSVLSKKEETKDGKLAVQLNDSAGRAIAEIIAPYSDVIEEYKQRDSRLSYR